MISNMMVFNTADFIVIIFGVGLALWKYGGLRLPLREPKCAVFLLNLSIMCHFFLRAGLAAAKSNRTFDLYLNLFVAILCLLSITVQYLKTAEALRLIQEK